MDELVIGGKPLASRLFLGTGKFADYHLLPDVVKAAGSQVVTVALRRVDFNNPGENMLQYLPENVTLMPNTSGARNADEAVRIARIARAAGCGNWVKVEVINDQKYLLPDNFETLKAVEILVRVPEPRTQTQDPGRPARCARQSDQTPSGPGELDAPDRLL